MIHLKQSVLHELASPQGLPKAVQRAIELEHATIPVYLFTLYSIDQALNPRVFNLIRGVVKEEMAHFALACNLLNAIGGRPQIDSATFVPLYPTNLPGSVHTSLIVGLSPFSLDHVRNVLMEIEEPEKPLEFKTDAMEIGGPTYPTIGAFYTAIKNRLLDEGPSIIVGDPKVQVTSDLVQLPNVWPIVDLDSAVRAIDHIVEQGEGTTETPTDDLARLAHYYRFAEILHGRELIKSQTPAESPESQYCYCGATITVDVAGIRALRPNPKVSMYSGDAKALAVEFNQSYTLMLKHLERAFGGEPTAIAPALEIMKTILRPLAMRLAECDLGDGSFAGPTFEYDDSGS